MLRSLAIEGRLIVIGFAGDEIPAVKVNRLLLANTTIMGAASEAFGREEPGTAAQQWRELLPLSRSWAVDPTSGAVFALSVIASALRAMDGRRAVGRMLVRVREGRLCRV